MSKEYIADKATLDNVNSIVSALNNRWPDARAGKVDNIQAVLNTPDGNTLAAWIQSISNSAANAYNKANEANNNAANAYQEAINAKNEAYNAKVEAINAKNAAGGSVVKSVQRGVSNVAAGGEQIVNINAVNMNKAILIITTTALGGGTSLAALYAYLKSSTQIGVISSYTYNGSTYQSQPMHWQVIEFY